MTFNGNSKAFIVPFGLGLALVAAIYSAGVTWGGTETRLSKAEGAIEEVKEDVDDVKDDISKIRKSLNDVSSEQRIIKYKIEDLDEKLDVILREVQSND